MTNVVDINKPKTARIKPALNKLKMAIDSSDEACFCEVVGSIGIGKTTLAKEYLDKNADVAYLDPESSPSRHLRKVLVSELENQLIDPQTVIIDEVGLCEKNDIQQYTSELLEQNKNVVWLSQEPSREMDWFSLKKSPMLIQIQS